MKKRHFLLLPYFFILTLYGQETGDYSSAGELMQAVDRAIGSEMYDRALTLIQEGKTLFPENSLFPARAGELYMDQKLFRLALEEFQAAEALNPAASIRYQLSRVHGFLDNNEESARYLEGLLDDFQYGKDAMADLGWMYFKLHRLRDGEALMLGALEKGFDRTYAHTLGTIYSGLYDYEKSKQYYLESIENALAGSDSYFAAVAYYNLALLEMSFYRYDRAMEFTNLSLEQVDRPSGHIARGELLQLALDYEGARDEFDRAYALNEDSPLAYLDLADLNREFGYLERTLEDIRDIRTRSDNSWMYYYGMNREEWDRDITEVFMDVYQGLLRENRVRPHWGIKGWADRVLKGIKYRWLHQYHRGRFRRICRKLGELQLKENNPLHGWILLAEGARGYRGTALYYWSLAEEYETSLTSRAEPWYLLRIGREMGSDSLIQQGHAGLIIPRENSARAEALAERIHIIKKGGLRKGESEEFLLLADELYSLNRGALRQKGISLPLTVDVAGTKEKAIARSIRRLHSRGDEEKASLCYHLTLIAKEGGSSSWYLQNPEGITVREGRYETNRLDREGRRELIDRVEEQIYGGAE